MPTACKVFTLKISTVNTLDYIYNNYEYDIVEYITDMLYLE
jgi:hypothetical protein